MEIFVGAGEISLCLHPTCIRIPPLKMEHLVNTDTLANARFIKLDATCHVLPSLKQAKIVSATRYVGGKNIFKNYSELQKHWRRMYGYLLPEVKENIWYLNVCFRAQNSTCYTYPEFCVKPYDLIQVPRVDPRPSLVCFVKDFCKNIGNICGEKCKIIECKASFPSLDMYPAIAIREDMKPRPGTTFAMNSTTSYRKSEKINASSTSAQNPSVLQKSQNNHCYKKDLAAIQKDQEKTNISISKSCQPGENNSNKYHENSKEKKQIDEKKAFINCNDKSSSNSEASSKYAPNFSRKTPEKKLLQMKLTDCLNKEKKFAPTFFPIKKKPYHAFLNSENDGCIKKSKLMKNGINKKDALSSKKTKKISEKVKQKGRK